MFNTAPPRHLGHKSSSLLSHLKILIMKTSMKMPLNLPGSALFAKINTIFVEREMSKFRKLTCDPLKYKMDQSMHAYCINMNGKSITMKRENSATLQVLDVLTCILFCCRVSFVVFPN